jgi:hypothetical protein
VIARPTILRARVCRALAERHPRGMTGGQVNQYLAWSSRSDEVREVLEEMVADGLIARGFQARPFPREPLSVYLASPLLLERSDRCQIQGSMR